MLKKISIAIVSVCVASALMVPTALARLDLDFATDVGGTPYQWYIPQIKLNFDMETRDGTWSDGRPYVRFKGTDRSPFGHCVEVFFKSGVSSPPYLQIYVKDHGVDRLVSNPNLQNEAYTSVRLWLNHNAGASGTYLPWALYILPNDNNTTFSGDVDISISRLELSKTNCTSGQASIPWVSFEGYTSSYTVTKGNF